MRLPTASINFENNLFFHSFEIPDADDGRNAMVTRGHVGRNCGDESTEVYTLNGQRKA